MQREASSSRAYLLMDYVQRLERHREGRRAVHIHLSKLKAQNRREHHLRIPENTFDELTKQFDGQAFAIQNGDIVFVCRDASIANMDDAVQRLRRLYEDDPLAQSIDAGHEDLFCNYYNVESQYAPFLEIAEGLYNEEQRRIKRLQMAAEQSGESMQGEQTPLSPQQLGKLVEFLGRADLSSVMRRQSICAVAGTDLPRPVFRELFISIGELAQQVLPNVNLAANRLTVPAFDGNARSAGVEITHAGRRSRFAFLLQREPERRHIVVAQIREIRHVTANRRARHHRDRTSTHRHLQRRRELYVRPRFRPRTRLSGLHRRRHTSKSAAARPTSAGRGSRQTRLASGIVGWRFGRNTGKSKQTSRAGRTIGRHSSALRCAECHLLGTIDE